MRVFRSFFEIFHFNNEPHEIIKTESQDFILQLSKSTLGIEITEVFKIFDRNKEPAPKQAIESGWESTLVETERIWKVNDYSKIEIDITCNDSYHVSKHNYKSIAKFSRTCP